MSLNAKLKKILFDRSYRFYILTKLNLTNFMSDEKYLKKKFKLLLGYELNLDNPQTFNEKLQWLKLYDRKPEYTIMVDKYAVKKYVADKIGEQYIIPTLGVWNNFDEIDFNSLPEQFVLKCTHDSGGIVIVRNKNEMDKKAAKKKLTGSLKRNYYLGGREWPYKDVPRKIIAEQYMVDESGTELKDYKFFCSNGNVRFLYLSQGLENHDTAHISYVNLDWTQAEFYRSDYKPFSKLPLKPINYKKMIELAEIMSSDIPFLRVDFYEINQKIFFGELTFFPGSGFTELKPLEWDRKLGNLIELPEKRA